MFQSPELDLQKEIYDLLFTDKDCSPIKIPYVHKKIKRDTQGNIIKCKCTYYNGFEEGSLTCPYCFGDGYLSNEVLINGFTYKGSLLREKFNLKMASQAGTNDSETLILVTDSSININNLDRIYSIATTNNKIDVPLNVIHKHTVYYTTKLRASTNSVDYNMSVLWD